MKKIKGKRLLSVSFLVAYVHLGCCQLRILQNDSQKEAYRLWTTKSKVTYWVDLRLKISRKRARMLKNNILAMIQGRLLSSLLVLTS